MSVGKEKRRLRLVFLLALAVLLLVALWRLLTPAPPPSPAGPEQPEMEVYFYQEGREGPPTAVSRDLLRRVSREQTVREAIRALLAGPTRTERNKGYTTAVPSGVELLKVEVERPLASLDFDAALERIGGTAMVRQLLDQLAYTAASVEGVKGVVLSIEGERVGTEERPFTGEGFLFRRLHPAVDSDWARRLGPADALDLFMAVIPEAEIMWRMMGPRARALYKNPSGIETSAFAEGLGAWRDYRVVREEIAGDEATVEIAGRQSLEGTVEPDARYVARMVREEGRWKWDWPMEE